MRGANDAINTVCRFASDTEVIGIVYLGWPTGTVETPTRPSANVNWL